jgi:uncharacterized membrane protein YfcA
VLIGTVVGVFVGMIGTSGAIMIPVLIFAFGLTQLRAQGTALFIALMPLWIFPVIPYWRAGNVEWKLGLTLAAGLAVGSYFGAQWAQQLPVALIRKMFAVVLAIVAVRMFLQR